MPSYTERLDRLVSRSKKLGLKLEQVGHSQQIVNPETGKVVFAVRKQVSARSIDDWERELDKLETERGDMAQRLKAVIIDLQTGENGFKDDKDAIAAVFGFNKALELQNAQLLQREERAKHYIETADKRIEELEQRIAQVEIEREEAIKKAAHATVLLGEIADLRSVLAKVHTMSDEALRNTGK